MTKKGARRRAARQEQISKQLRQALWPNVPATAVWSRHATAGFTTIPRALSHILRFLDELSPSKPLGNTYFTLWCWARDEYIVTIRHAIDFAVESGFAGQRADSTWRDRMRKLRELGFILSEKGSYGEFSHVLVLNPFHVLKRLFDDNKLDVTRWNAFQMRLAEVGSTDLVRESDDNTS